MYQEIIASIAFVAVIISHLIMDNSYTKLQRKIADLEDGRTQILKHILLNTSSANAYRKLCAEWDSKATLMIFEEDLRLSAPAEVLLFPGNYYRCFIGGNSANIMEVKADLYGRKCRTPCEKGD
jgi:hypothetical protein